MSRYTFTIMLCGILSLSASLSGCGGPKAPEHVSEATASVKGTVTLKGRPLTNGNIVLYSLTNGNMAETSLNSKGEFSFAEQLPAVKYTVFFRDSNGNPHPKVPVEYQSETSSTYSVTVNSGENDLAIDIVK